MMKHVSNHLMLALLVCLLGSVATLSSCDKKQKEQPTPPQKDDVHHFAYIAHAEKSFKITTFKDFQSNIVTTYDNAKSIAEGHAFMQVYDGFLYVMSGNMMGFGGEQTLYKYTISELGRLSDKPVATLSFSNSPNVVEIVFASKNKAYGITNHSRAELIIFNPTTMKEIGKISLAQYGAGEIKDQSGKVIGKDNDPDPGLGIIRDGKLYLPLSQFNGMALADVPGQLAIIDTKTDKVEKIITDSRVQGLGMIGHTNPIMDESGHLYFYTGPMAAMLGSKEGMLRIKKGETEFDKDFYIPFTKLPEASQGSYAMTILYAGNGKAYFFLLNPKLMKSQDPSDPQNKGYMPYELDLRSGTGRALPLKPSTGWAANALIKVGDKIYFGCQSDNGVGFFGYDPKSNVGDTKPAVVTPTGAYKVIQIK